MRRTPLERMASSTLKVAMVFCSRSRRAGCWVPKRTSAFAARWKNKIGAAHTWLGLEPPNRVCRRAPAGIAGCRHAHPSRNTSKPVDKIVEAGHSQTAVAASIRSTRRAAR